MKLYLYWVDAETGNTKPMKPVINVSKLYRL